VPDRHVMNEEDPLATPGSSGPESLEATTETWNVLANSLGTTATAALMRRAARRATIRSPALSGFRVEGTGYTYRFVVPPAWNSPDGSAFDDARGLLEELCSLLWDLTGDVVTSRLAATPAIRPFLPADVLRRTNPNAISR
jgi:hypothetical protein